MRGSAWSRASERRPRDGDVERNPPATAAGPILRTWPMSGIIAQFRTEKEDFRLPILAMASSSLPVSFVDIEQNNTDCRVDPGARIVLLRHSLDLAER